MKKVKNDQKSREGLLEGVVIFLKTTKVIRMAVVSLV